MGEHPFYGFSHSNLKSLRISNFCSFYLGKGGELEEEDNEVFTFKSV